MKLIFVLLVLLSIFGCDNAQSSESTNYNPAWTGLRTPTPKSPIFYPPTPTPNEFQKSGSYARPTPTPSPTPTPGPTPTFTPVPSPTPTSTPVPTPTPRPLTWTSELLTATSSSLGGLGWDKGWQNFEVQAIFYNPEHIGSSGWDYGFYFHGHSNGNNFVNITSTGSWSYEKTSSNEWTEISSGVIPENLLDTHVYGSNKLRLIVEDSAGEFFLNEVKIADIRASKFPQGLALGASTCIHIQNCLQRPKATRVEDFRAVPIGIQPVPPTPTPRATATPRPRATPTPFIRATPTPRPRATPTPRPRATPTPFIRTYDKGDVIFEGWVSSLYSPARMSSPSIFGGKSGHGYTQMQSLPVFRTPPDVNIKIKVTGMDWTPKYAWEGTPSLLGLSEDKIKNSHWCEWHYYFDQKIFGYLGGMQLPGRWERGQKYENTENTIHSEWSDDTTFEFRWKCRNPPSDQDVTLNYRLKVWVDRGFLGGLFG